MAKLNASTGYEPMRNLTKPSTAHCNLECYVNYLLGEPKPASCSRLGEVVSITHDSVNRFLIREHYTQEDLFNEIKGKIELEGGILSIDDTVIDKPYSKIRGLIGYYWSGKHKRVVLGINLLTLYYTDRKGMSVPVNFRLYDKTEGKTKNDYFREMLTETQANGIKAKSVTGDSWYSSVENLKFIRNEKLGFLFGIEKNRKISQERGIIQQVQTVEIPSAGLLCYLPTFGEVKVFSQKFKNEFRYDLVYSPAPPEKNPFNEEEFKNIRNLHWGIEQYHRVLKQVCNIEHFQVRTELAIRNHIFSALCGYVKLSILKASGQIANCYEIQKKLFLEVIAKFIRENPENHHLVSSHPSSFVNA